MQNKSDRYNGEDIDVDTSIEIVRTVKPQLH